jgi:hypothetical protein
MRNQQAELLYKRAAKIALELSIIDFPNIWRVKDNQSHYTIRIYTAGAWLFIRIDGARLEICTTNPPEIPSQYSRDSITVNINRDPEAIAKDIYRRIVPSAQTAFIQGRAQARKENAQRRATAETVHKIARFFGGHKKHQHEDRYTDLYGSRAKAEIQDGKISELRLEKVTTAEAVKILEILYPKDNP